MGFFDRLFGAPEPEPQRQPVPQARQQRQRQLTDDELAVERYRYLLRTAPPETVEQVHAEAFAKLTPEQREQVYASLAEQAPEGERPTDDEPQTLARAATRQEMREPGSMERAFGGGPGRQGGPSFGGMFAGSLLGTVAGVVVGSAIAQAFLPDPSAFEAGGDAGAGDAGAGDAGAGDAGAVDAGSADASGGDFGGGDFGGGGGDFGGFGGGDFGGDFGF
jgi:hypothetical protein